MKSLIILVVTATIVISTIAGRAFVDFGNVSTASATPLHQTTKKTLRAFRSEKELKSYFQKLTEEQQRRQQLRAQQNSNAAPKAEAQSPADSVAAPVATARAATVTTGADKDESVTNVQHAGVDEGGIVKLHGDFLVVLRRGRLFTVKVGDGALRPVSTVDAFAPGIDPSNDWYDEMLVSGETIAVIGYSYERGGTEIGLFNIDRNGSLSYRGTHHLRSDDYYSSRNYASRLIGNKLIFYTPMYLPLSGEETIESFPAQRKWHRGATDGEFRRIISPTRIYRTEQELDVDSGLALHTVTTCDLARSDFKCEATAVIGAPGRVFYVSPESVYVWTSDWMRSEEQARTRSMLYRMPLDGSAPSALQVSGSPVDQFSFLESEDEHLNVLVRSDASGDTMWDAEAVAGDVALLRVSLGSFSDGTAAAPPESYRELPKPVGDTFQNRFVGEYLLYGTGSGWGAPEQLKNAKLYAVRWASGNIVELSLAHGVDRIEAMGADAVVIGTDGEDLHFTGVRLGAEPGIAHRYTRKEASQGELRSHGFFYKPDGEDSGLLGLPISEPGRPGYEHLFEDSASILFLRNDSLRLTELGDLKARAEGSVDDNCRASCVDWYGNARPLFVRGRIFALLGYEIVEGRLSGNGIREKRRVSYAPRRQKIARR
jgi:Beta propeller domain.